MNQYRFTFQNITTLRALATDDLALAYAESLTDSAASAAVERQCPVTGIWLAWSAAACGWFPALTLHTYYIQTRGTRSGEFYDTVDLPRGTTLAEANGHLDDWHRAFPGRTLRLVARTDFVI